MNVFVVGGGPAGLLAAAKLSELGFRTTLVEEHAKLGYPEHCTGIVRDDFVRLVGYSELERVVLAKYTGGCVSLELGGQLYRVETSRVKAIMINRPLYERMLGELASAAGARIVLGKKADIVKVDGSYRVRLDGETVRPDLVIGARGPRANPNLRVITGLQAYVASNRKLEEDKVYVTFSSLFPDFFGWAAPYGDGCRAKVGLASSSKNLRSLLGMVSEGFLGTDYRVEGYFGGPVVVGSRGFASALGEANYVPVGDEAGLVKPLTGGGLDLGVFAVNRLIEDLRRGLGLKRYRRWLYGVKLKIIGAQAARSVFFGHRSFGRSVAQRLLGYPELASVLRRSDFDDHVDVLLKAALLFMRRSIEGLL